MSYGCNQTLGTRQVEWRTYVSVTLGALSLAVCFIDVAIFFAMHLHRKTTYRLAVYQVVSSMAVAGGVSTSSLLAQHYGLPKIAAYACISFLAATKYVLALWLTIHVLVAVVCYKTIIPKMEPVYIISTVLLSLTMILVYVVVSVARDCSETVVMQGFRTMIYTVACATVLNLALVLFIFAVLLCRLHHPLYRRPLVARHYRLALYETLPLLGYPMVTVLMCIPLAIVMKYSVLSQRDRDTVYELWIQVLNTACGVLFMVHMVCVIRANR